MVCAVTVALPVGPVQPVNDAAVTFRAVPSDWMVPFMVDVVQLPAPSEVDTVMVPRLVATTAPENSGPVWLPLWIEVAAAEAGGAARATAAAAAAPARVRFLMRDTGCSLVLLPEGQREINSPFGWNQYQ